jgi:hypothetical protein
MVARIKCSTYEHKWRNRPTLHSIVKSCVEQQDSRTLLGIVEIYATDSPWRRIEYLNLSDGLFLR